MSTEAVIAREVAAVVRDVEGRPGYWRPFLLRHAAVTLLFVAVLVGVTVVGPAGPAGLARGTALALVVMAAVTAFDGVQHRRRLRRALRIHHRTSCPPGTVVHALWTPEYVLFRVPTHEVRLALGTVTAGRHDGGVLRLDQDGSAPAWVVPDELLGQEALAIVRGALGTRLRETL